VLKLGSDFTGTPVAKSDPKDYLPDLTALASCITAKQQIIDRQQSEIATQKQELDQLVLPTWRLVEGLNPRRGTGVCGSKKGG